MYWTPGLILAAEVALCTYAACRAYTTLDGIWFDIKQYRYERKWKAELAEATAMDNTEVTSNRVMI